ncbi:MAG: HU family DNA-binding protein [Kiritimatiellae bacterium]|nr:HU family DNA-binding protein [Kiritimatiellia bacterium]MBR1837412.1 HU family DNA-binding protein [Kiritimatiellia bacterium]
MAPKKVIKTKAQIVEAVAEKAAITKKQSKDAIEALVAIAYEGAKQKDGFTVPGLGKLVLKQQKARTGRNPATGATIKIPAKKVVKFRLAKAAKDAILPPKK